MTVNGQTEEIKSAIYAEAPAGEFGENGVGLYLFKDVLTGMPEEEPDFGIMIVITESLYGKTIDLTKPVARSSYLLIAGMNKTSMSASNATTARSNDRRRQFPGPGHRRNPALTAAATISPSNYPSRSPTAVRYPPTGRNGDENRYPE
ncbi:MAG: hypothetical protein ACLR93_11010 [Alistipes onderdonkii]